MDYKNEEEKKSESLRRMRGWVFFCFFIGLILAGIVAKRAFGHPDLVVFFHVPAALFLVMATNALSYNVRKKYQENLKNMAFKKRLTQSKQ